jgi:hypothetical protein
MRVGPGPKENLKLGLRLVDHENSTIVSPFSPQLIGGGTGIEDYP